MRILIAEDSLTSRQILEGMLKMWGHEVVATCDGNEAWDALQSGNAPRLAILDWMMPGMDGDEICRKIRLRNSEYYTYVVLLSAKGLQKDIVAGFAAGADDYLVKPINRMQLAHRVKAASRVVRYEAELSESKAQMVRYAGEMESLAHQRARQLAHADRMATLGLLSAGVAHEINNPLTLIAGNTQTMQKAWDIVKNSLESSGIASTVEDKQLNFVIKEFPEIFTGIRNGVDRITKIISGLKSYARQNKGERKLFDIHDSIKNSQELCHSRLKKHVSIKTHFADAILKLVGDKQQIEQVFVNLFINAADATQTQGEGVLRITTTLSGQMIKITIDDNGPGFPTDVIDKLFTPFFTTKKQDKGTGLGLSISQGIIEEHGGTISAENLPGGGARFMINLPITNSVVANENILQIKEKDQ